MQQSRLAAQSSLHRGNPYAACLVLPDLRLKFDLTYRLLTPLHYIFSSVVAIELLQPNYPSVLSTRLPFRRFLLFFLLRKSQILSYMRISTCLLPLLHTAFQITSFKWLFIWRYTSKASGHPIVTTCRAPRRWWFLDASNCHFVLFFPTCFFFG